jgi:hypothetical protein
MKTKIGLPFGLALVMFIGIFTTMLALGALNPQPAEAQFADLDSTMDGIQALEVTVSNNASQAIGTWTFKAKTASDNTLAEADNENITIAFPSDFAVPSEADVNLGTWTISDITGADLPVTVSGEIITLDIPEGQAIAVDKEFTITFVPGMTTATPPRNRRCRESDI